MKQLISLLLILMLAVGVLTLTACKNTETKTADQPVSAVETVRVIPDDLTPIGTNEDGSATGYTKLDKDEKGRVTRDYTYDSLGELKGSIGYEYDDNDYVVKEIRYDVEGNITSQVAFERDEDGLETKRTDMDAQGNVKTIIVTEYYEDGSTERTKYDADGNVIG